MTMLLQDATYALRKLRKTPGFTITVLLTLALGIGANAAIFTLVNAVLLRDLPVTDPATLVRFGEGNDCCVNGGINDNGSYNLFSTETYRILRQNLPEFEDIAAMQAGFPFVPVTVRRDVQGEQARSVMSEFVSGNYFRTFGLKPVVGRMLTDADNVKGAPMVAVVSYATWQHNFNSDPRAVGSTLWVNTKPVTVVGVAPKGFFGDRIANAPPEFYLPIEAMPAIANAVFVNDPTLSWLEIVGRLKPGTVVTPQLQQKVDAAFRQSLLASNKDFQGKEGPERLAKAHATLTPGGSGIEFMKEQYAANLKLLMGVAGLVLLIACANIANLLLVRGMERRTEMSVRTALGAQRMRLIRQMLTESVVLSLLGGLAGLAVAYGGTKMLLALAFPGDQRVTIDATPSLAVIGFAFVLALVTGVLFGVAPAWMAARAQPADALRSGSRTTAAGASLLQRSLVILQAALSLVLLVGAGLFTQSLSKLETSDLKLDAANRYIVHMNPQAAGYTATQLEGLYRTIEERFHQVPGVVKVSLATYTPMENNNWSTGIKVQGLEQQKGDFASYVKATSEYFDSVGTKVVMGRGITAQDTSTSPAVAVVNQTFVKKLLRGHNPLGMRFGAGNKGQGDLLIVGVVEDTVYSDLRWKDHSMYFLPLTQRRPSTLNTPIEDDLGLFAGAIVVQTDRPMNEMESIARRTLSSINPNLTVSKFQTFDQQIADRFNNDRLVARLTMLFGALALLLATIGLYGVTAYAVVRRTSEIGIRMALGAERWSVVAMVLRGAAMQTIIGLAIGVPVALLSVRFIKSQLYEITGVSFAVMLFAVMALALAACIAGLIPARRAASIDPMKALRTE